MSNRGIRKLLALLGGMSVAAIALSAQLNVSVTGGAPLIDGDGSCALDASQNNAQICTNDVARYRVQYQAIAPAPSSNLTITSGPLPAGFRWSKQSPGIGSCVNPSAARISADGKTLTCVVAASGLVSGTLDFDVTTDSVAQNGSVLPNVTFGINNDENSPAVSGGQKASTATGVTVVAQPQVDAYKLLYGNYFEQPRPTYSTFTANRTTQSSSGSPTLCGGVAGETGIYVAFRIGGNATQLKGHERLANSFSFTDDLSGFPAGTCVADIYPLARIEPGFTNPAVAAGASPDLNGTCSWTQTSATSATITVTGADTSGSYPYAVGANTNSVFGCWGRFWIPKSAFNTTSSISGVNKLRDFDPTSISGVSNFGGIAGSPPACPLSAADALTVEPDYCGTNPTGSANRTNQAAWGPIVLGRGEFGKYFQQTSETFATTQDNAGDYPYLTNDWIGPGDKVDSFTLAGNGGAGTLQMSLCDKWDNRKLRLITVDPNTVRTHAGTGPTYLPTGNAQYYKAYGTTPASVANGSLATAVGYAHSYPYDGATAPAGSDYEFGRVGGASITDDSLSAAGCDDADSILATLGVGPTSPWVTNAQLLANPTWAQYVNAVRFRDVTLPPGVFAAINPHLQVLPGDPSGSPAVYPIGTIIPNFGTVKWTGANLPTNGYPANTWYNPYYHPGNDAEATYVAGCTANPEPDPAKYCGAENPGRRLRLTTMEPKIRKGLVGVDPVDGPIVAPTAEPTSLGKTHRFQLWPTLNVYAPAAPITADAVIKDVLPNGLIYLGNATIGGVPVTPASVAPNTPSAGQTTIVWVIPNQVAQGIVQTKLPVIEFDAQVDLDNPVNTPNSVLKNVTEVRACSPGASVVAATAAITCVDFNPKQSLADRSADRSLILGTSGALIAVKTVTPAVDQILTGHQMAVRYKNAGSSPVSENRIVDKLPYNNDARGNPSPTVDQSRFSGTSTLTTVTVAGTSGYTVYYSTAAVTSIDDDPKCPTNIAVAAWAGVVGSGSGCSASAAPGWTLATQAGSVWTVAAGATAIFVRDANAMAPTDPSRQFAMNFTTAGNRDGDRYSNNAFVSNTTVQFYQLTNDVTTRKIAASLSGTVFVDPNQNGGTAGFEPGTDTPLGGQTVTLKKGTATVGTAVTATADIPAGQFYNPATGAASATYGPGVCPVPAAGLKQGQYLFCDLVAGNDYSLVETQPSGYATTGNNAGNGATPGTVNNATDTISAIGITTGQNATGYDFGELPLTTVSGRVYVESNGNTLDNGNGTDPGIGNVSVALACTPPYTGTSPLITTSTGTYQFTGVTPGAQCTITETQPSPYTNAYTQTGISGNPGTLGSVSTAGAGTTTNSTITITVPPTGSPQNNFAEQAADMTSSIACVPPGPAGGASTTCTVTCTNNGPGAALSPLCTITNAASLPGNPAVVCTPNPLPASLANAGSVSCSVTFNAPNSGSVTINGSTGATNDNNGGTNLTGANSGNNPSTTQINIVPADMRPAFSNLPVAVGPGTLYTGLVLTCSNVGNSTATQASCVPTASAGTVSNVACVAQPPVDVVTGGNIRCTFDYTAPSSQGGANTTETAIDFFGRTTATNDSVGGSDTTVCAVNPVAPNNNCVRATVPVVDAIDDAPSTQQFATTGSTNYPLLTNDQLGTTTGPVVGTGGVSAPTITGVTLNGSTVTNPFTIDPATGALVVPNNTPPGVYVVTYQICANGTTNACDTAIKTVTIEASDMTSAIVCTPSGAVSGTATTCVLTCTNNGPNIANNATCAFTSGLPAGTTVSCVPVSPAATVAVRGTIVCTTTSFPAPINPTQIVGGTGADNDSNGGATQSAGNNPANASVGAPPLPVPVAGVFGLSALALMLAAVGMRRRRLMR